MSMSVKHQLRLANRIRAELLHEAETLRRDKNELSAIDRQGMADGMNDIINTLRHVRMLQTGSLLLLSGRRKLPSEDFEQEEP